MCYQKSGIEFARRDPFCDGYCFWTLVDVVVPLDVGVSGQGWLTPLWFRLVKIGRRLPDASFSERDLVAVGEGGEHRYVYLAEKPRSFHVFGLDLLSETPEAASLLDNFIDYALGKE